MRTTHKSLRSAEGQAALAGGLLIRAAACERLGLEETARMLTAEVARRRQQAEQQARQK